MDRYSDSFNFMLRDLDALRREIGRALQKGSAKRWVEPFTPMALLPGFQTRVHPLVNSNEDREAVYLEAMVPGVDPASLNIAVLRNQLTLSGNQPGARPELPSYQYHRNERSAGKSVRTIPLPCEVETDRVTAEYRNGLLALTLPKAESAKTVKIVIQTD